jgi:carboxypeptidase Taq
MSYAEYVTLSQKAADFNNAAAVLGWDQETYMPPKGFALRGRQLATLASAAHEVLTSPRYVALVAELQQDASLTESERANVQRSAEDLRKAQQLSPQFVEALSLQTTICFEAWMQARESADFSLFEAPLQRMIELKREQAERYGYAAHPYDALLDDYEPGVTVAMLDPVLADLKASLVALLQRIAAAPQVPETVFFGQFPKERQLQFTETILRQMGYDFEAGRQDYSEHPFSTSFGPEDARITTRADEGNLAYMLWSSIHEGGHALYEQGLPADQYGLPLGAACSLSIHESQSRLWENCVGRSRAFWQAFYPQLQALFPEQLASYTIEDWFRAANRVAPSLIRTEADELTYHFHVLIRYELEKDILSGILQARDLPDAWNAAYQKYLGITPPNDREGVLQDVHWAHGSFGYFPTYTLGSLYAAQFFEAAQQALPELESQFAAGDCTALLHWLRQQIHRYGRQFLSEELCQRITGRGLDSGAFIRYLEGKLVQVYPAAF